MLRKVARRGRAGGHRQVANWVAPQYQGGCKVLVQGTKMGECLPLSLWGGPLDVLPCIDPLSGTVQDAAFLWACPPTHLLRRGCQCLFAGYSHNPVRGSRGSWLRKSVSLGRGGQTPQLKSRLPQRCTACSQKPISLAEEKNKKSDHI